MTTRDVTALLFVVLGAVALLAGAYAYDGVRAVAVTGGVLLLIIGVLLGLDDGDPGGPVVLGPFDRDEPT